MRVKIQNIIAQRLLASKRNYTCKKSCK